MEPMIGRPILGFVGAILIGVSANQILAQAVLVNPATTPSAATTKPAPRTFEGRVIDADDKPIANAKVWLIHVVRRECSSKSNYFRDQ
jgi:hypothetical protein